MAVNSDDYYELLGISRSADEKEIKSAYKKAARKYHPDNTETGDEETFKKVGEAYDVLKDPQKKALYDQYGKDGIKGMGGFGGAGGFGGGFSSAGFEDLSDVFSSFFGGGFGGGFAGAGRGRNRARAGQDQSIDISLDFIDVIKEHKKKIKFNPLQTCSSCDGKGAKSSSDIVTCATCGGHGQVSSVQNTILGQIRQTTTCPTCAGTGKQIKNPCGSCRGKGLKREDKEVEVTIPAGVYDGATMRLAGIGDAGTNGGPPGDIYLHINVAPHKNFSREHDGVDVFSQINIGFADASLGIELEVPTLRGKHKLKIKSGTQAGDVYTIKNEGIPRLNNPSRNGDQYVKVNVVTPSNLSGKEKDLLQEFQKLRQDKDTKV